MDDKDIQNTPPIGQKLRAARQRQQLSLRDLAEKARVSASLLSKIENGKANPSVRSLHSIADALGLPINHFFPEEDEVERQNDADLETAPDAMSEVSITQFEPAQAATLIDDMDLRFDDKVQPSNGPVVRANARRTIELMGGVTWSRLTPGSEDGIEIMEICYDEGMSSGNQMTHHNGRELHLVLEGELLLELGFERYLLKPGDSITYDSTTPHRLSNVGQGPMRAVSVIFNTK